MKKIINYNGKKYELVEIKSEQKEFEIIVQSKDGTIFRIFLSHDELDPDGEINNFNLPTEYIKHCIKNFKRYHDYENIQKWIDEWNLFYNTKIDDIKIIHHKKE